MPLNFILVCYQSLIHLFLFMFQSTVVAFYCGLFYKHVIKAFYTGHLGKFRLISYAKPLQHLRKWFLLLFSTAVASFPYPVPTPALAYRGSALRGRGRAVYNTIRSAATAATPAAVPAYPGWALFLSITLGFPNVLKLAAHKTTKPQHTRRHNQPNYLTVKQ